MAFTVENMHCASCASKMKSEICQCAGIQKVRIDVTYARVFVEWEGERIGFQAIVKKWDEMGYPMRLHRVEICR